MVVMSADGCPPHKSNLRIGSVSFLNAKPLIYGLEKQPDLEVRLEIPSRLLDGVRERRFDLALLPIIDYQHLPDSIVVPAGGIGCDGPTLTVRIFSKVPLADVTTLACDTDSHTSVALARIVFAERYGIAPEFVPLHAATDQPTTAWLLIGDKVVSQEPTGFPHQIDLGQAWKELTGLPFVFAAWITRAGIDLRDLPARLETAWERGLADVEQIIARFAQPHGWPADVARKYLTHYLKFNIGPRQLEAIALFHQLAARHGLIPQPPRPIELHRGV